MMSIRTVAACAAALCSGCAGFDAPGVPATGKPIGEFYDELKAELREVHWRIRSDIAACGTTDKREIDLRNATVTLDMHRIGEAVIDGEVRLVALPLAGGALTPYASAAASRKGSRELSVKLDVAGAAPLYDLATAPQAQGALARTLNAAIDGFMRSSPQEPCIRLSSLKLVFVLDVERSATGGFRLVVPAVQFSADATQREVNTLTLSWDKVASNAAR